MLVYKTCAVDKDGRFWSSWVRNHDLMVEYVIGQKTVSPTETGIFVFPEMDNLAYIGDAKDLSGKVVVLRCETDVTRVVYQIFLPARYDSVDEYKGSIDWHLFGAWPFHVCMWLKPLGIVRRYEPD